LERFEVSAIRLAPGDRPLWIERVAEQIGVLPTPPQIGLFNG
jgi:hypothetical protein